MSRGFLVSYTPLSCAPRLGRCCSRPHGLDKTPCLPSLPAPPSSGNCCQIPHFCSRPMPHQGATSVLDNTRSAHHWLAARRAATADGPTGRLPTGLPRGRARLCPLGRQRRHAMKLVCPLTVGSARSEVAVIPHGRTPLQQRCRGCAIGDTRDVGDGGPSPCPYGGWLLGFPAVAMSDAQAEPT